MSFGIKKISTDENGNSFAISSKVTGTGSVFVKSGDDLILQEDLRNGTGIFLIDITETNSSGTFTVALPSNILSNTDDHFELDSNNDFALKT
tara:strand:+ start:1541 stop:1816 length:276 start_codon:yes stop_codon:yes gene_type:complete